MTYNNNNPLKSRTAFMDDLVDGINERSCDTYIWFLTIGICVFGVGIVALVSFFSYNQTLGIETRYVPLCHITLFFFSN